MELYNEFCWFVSFQARLMIMNAGLPDEVINEIEHAYSKMCVCNLHTCGKDCSVAVRSSATAEDLPTASFAGQQASFLNVVGKHSVCNTVLECLASVFTDRAIAYRVHNGFGHMDVKGAGEKNQSKSMKLSFLNIQIINCLVSSSQINFDSICSTNGPIGFSI